MQNRTLDLILRRSNTDSVAELENCTIFPIYSAKVRGTRILNSKREMEMNFR